MLHRSWLLLLCVVLLAGGCSSAAPESTPVAGRPTTAPATASPPVDLPTVQPLPTLDPAQVTPLPPTTGPAGAAAQTTPTLAGAPLLPAPLYFIDNGQIQRLERDGQTTRTITAEIAAAGSFLALSDFDVSPADGSLAYAAAGSGSAVLLRTDALGGNRTPLIELPGATISNPRFSPDGARLAFHVGYDPDLPAPQPAGIYFIPATGGAAELIHADDPRDPEYLPAPRVYVPVAWSPDGQRLLVESFFWFVRMCGLDVKHLASGELVRLVDAGYSVESTGGCDSGSWTRDGNAVYMNQRPVWAPYYLPGLWRADPATGNALQIIPDQIDGLTTQVRGARQLADGRLYYLLTTTDQEPGQADYDPPLRFTLFSAAPDGMTDRMALHPDQFVPNQVLWAADGSGAVIEHLAADRGPQLLWVPTDGSPPLVLPADGFGVGRLVWGLP